MKLLCSALFAIQALASAPHVFTASDYAEYTKDGVVVINAAPGTRQALQNRGAEAALASVIHAAFEKAMENGVDLPETIDIEKVVYLKNLGIFNLVSGDTIYSVVTKCGAASCTAMEAIVQVVPEDK